jgi:hypothetical protein
MGPPAFIVPAAFAAALTLVLAQAPAFAQTATSGKEPMSTQASNIDKTDTRTTYAPALPAPPMSAESSPRDLLMAAQHDLMHHQTGAAQQALEMAETRVLDRTVPAGEGSMPDGNPMVGQISQALHLLGTGDVRGASQVIDSALAAKS